MKGGRRPLLLRNGDFAAVWVGQVASQAALRMSQVGLVWWLVGQVTAGRRGLTEGLLMVLGTLPAALLVPVVARTLARGTSRSVMRAAAATAAAVAAALGVGAAIGGVPILAAYPVALMLAVCQAFFDPCVPKSVAELVDDRDIENATAIGLATQSVAGMTGAFAAPILVDRSGLAGLVSACAVAYALAAVMVNTACFRPVGTAAAHASPRRRLREILTGFPLLRSILLCLAAVNVFSTAVFVIFPLYTKTVLGAGGLTFALLEAGLAAGTLLGALTGKYLRGRATAIGAACISGFAVALTIPGLYADRTTTVLSLVVAGWCVGALGVRLVTLFQRTVPAADKPGFFALLQAVIGATFPVASLVFGLLGDWLSPQTLCLIQAVGVLPAALALRALAPQEQALLHTRPALADVNLGGKA